MYKVYFLLIVVFLVCTITFSNAWSLSSLYTDSSAKFKRETLNKQNATAVQEEDIPDNYTCKNGELISALFRCNGEIDCKDKSDESHELCSEIICSPYLFRCTYGACIAQDKMCDGKQDCIDGSDEDYGLCSSNGNQNLSVIVRQKRQNCDFKCGSGECISTEQLCDGITDCQDGSNETRAQCENERSGCLLPQHPQHGHYQLFLGGAYKVNAIVASGTIVTIVCDQGYTTNQTTFFLCNENRWHPEFSYCIRPCPTIPQSETYDATCNLEGKKVSCENPIEGTTVRITCKPYYLPAITTILTIPMCADGIWDQPMQTCVPECGRKIVNVETLVIGGSYAQKGEYPWMAAIYNTSSNNKEHICGGSIISRAFVLSAAHCFADWKGVVYDKSLFTVAAGKHYRDLNTAEPGSQIRKVERIFVHEDYKGRLTKYRDDIAVIEVEKFEITLHVWPVCIDWDNIYEENDFKDGNKAVVAGWGFTSEASIPYEVLKKLIVPFRSTDTCRQFIDPDFFQQYYSSDKICAGYKDEGTSVCSGDSGGGLYFRSQPTQFFVRAVLSLAPRSQAGCNSNHYALFTKVSKYVTWLESITRKQL